MGRQRRREIPVDPAETTAGDWRLQPYRARRAPPRGSKDLSTSSETVAGVDVPLAVLHNRGYRTLTRSGSAPPRHPNPPDSGTRLAAALVQHLLIDAARTPAGVFGHALPGLADGVSRRLLVLQRFVEVPKYSRALPALQSWRAFDGAAEIVNRASRHHSGFRVPSPPVFSAFRFAVKNGSNTSGMSG